MEWKPQFSHAAHQMRRNTVREFLKLAKRPEIISFGGGLPAAELFPITGFERAADSVLTRFGPRTLQYGETEGVPELRDYLAAKAGVAQENILITNGAQQALDLLGRVLLDQGDFVSVENPTYLALLSAWRPLDPVFTATPSDGDGMDVDEIMPGSKLLYLVPNFQNPQGTTLSLERRLKLSDRAACEKLIVIEDDPYGELRYEGNPLPSLFELTERSAGPVVNVGTFSKVLAPGLRVGWIAAGTDLIDKLVQARQAMDLHTSTLNQYLALELATNGLLEKHVPMLRAAYRTRRDTMLHALEERMPGGVRWTKPAGGMFLLVTLPPGLDAAELARAALNENVLIVPGKDFHISGGENTFRLNFSNCRPELISEGIQRLSQVLQKQVTLDRGEFAGHS